MVGTLKKKDRRRPRRTDVEDARRNTVVISGFRTWSSQSGIGAGVAGVVEEGDRAYIGWGWRRAMAWVSYAKVWARFDSGSAILEWWLGKDDVEMDGRRKMSTRDGGR